MNHLAVNLTPYTLQLLIVATAWYAATQYCLDRARRNTRRKLREETARREAAEASNKAKAYFLTSMSHEIRAPLNAIIGFTDLALKTELNPELRDYLATVRASADWLTHVVSEVVDFARVESGAVQLSDESFGLREILRSAVNIADPLAKQRKLMLRLHLDAALPQRVRGDSTRLLQVIFNLIDNAVKFTTQGSVLVTATVQERGSETVSVRIVVADTGIGIAPERLEHLFEPLTTPLSSLDRRSRACGFGLPICHRLINMMGGSLEVQSRIGAGSTFGFTLTFATPRQEAPAGVADDQAASHRRVHVLVADGHGASRLLATALLQGAGHRVTEATTGLEALKFFTSGMFDLVLMDLGLPDLDGIEATKAMRVTERSEQPTPIYAVNAEPSKDRLRCLDAGMNGCLTSPLNIETLLGIINSLPPGQVLSAHEGADHSSEQFAEDPGAKRGLSLMKGVIPIRVEAS